MFSFDWAGKSTQFAVQQGREVDKHSLRMVFGNREKRKGFEEGTRQMHYV
jgi:hypothetical protein